MFGALSLSALLSRRRSNSVPLPSQYVVQHCFHSGKGIELVSACCSNIFLHSCSAAPRGCLGVGKSESYLDAEDLEVDDAYGEALKGQVMAMRPVRILCQRLNPNL
eukprot:3235437-Rhodomonas_salina.3